MNRFVLAGGLPDKLILTDDPLRVKMMAAHHMEAARLLYEQRGMCCYTGAYRGIPLAALACGFGAASARLYIDECAALGAREIVYLGECVALAREAALMDVIAADGADAALLERARRAASLARAAFTVRPVKTDELFWLDGAAADGAAFVDFAAEAVYDEARKHGVSALALLTVSENAATGEQIDDAARQSRFRAAAALAFETLAIQGV